MKQNLLFCTILLSQQLLLKLYFTTAHAVRHYPAVIFSTYCTSAKKNIFLNCHDAICALIENDCVEASSHDWSRWLYRLELTLPHCQNIMLSIWKPSWLSLPAASKMVVLAPSRAALIAPSLAVCQALILSSSLPALSLITCLLWCDLTN